jgi:hypothetical protein
VPRHGEPPSPRRSIISHALLPNTDLIVEPKPKLNRHLPVIDGIVGDIAACFDDLKPVNIVQCFTSLGNGILDGVFHTRFGRPGQLDLFVNMIAHWKASFFTIAIFAFGAITIPATGCALVVEK